MLTHNTFPSSRSPQLSINYQDYQTDLFQIEAIETLSSIEQMCWSVNSPQGKSKSGGMRNGVGNKSRTLPGADPPSDRGTADVTGTGGHAADGDGGIRL